MQNVSMHTGRYVAVGFFCLFVPVILYSQQAQTPLIAMDKPLRWAHEKESSVRRAVGQKHVYFLLPWGVDAIIENQGVPAFSLTHYGITCDDERGMGGTLVARVKPVFGASPALGSGSVDDLKSALTARDPKAVVIVPVPFAVKWEAILNASFGTSSFQTLQGDSGDSLIIPRQFEAQLSGIGARAVLLSSEGDPVGARLTYRVTGKTSRHSKLVEQEFSVGGAFGFSCKKYPSAFKDLTLGGTGCLVHYRTESGCGGTDHPPH